MNMKKHFVEFYSPGTFFDEFTTKEISEWSPEIAVEMSREIKERHGALPYGFRFITRERGDEDLDSKITERSGTYFLGGVVFTLEELKQIGDPKHSILIRNMENNGWDRVIRNQNSYEIWKPFLEGDKCLEEAGFRA